MPEDDPTAADDFFARFGFGPMYHNNRFYEALDKGHEILHLCAKLNPDVYLNMHKGYPFYWMGMAAYRIHDFQSAIYYIDVAIPDGFEVKRKTTFTKTWRVENTGSCVWSAGEVYLEHIDGKLMNAVTRIFLKRDVYKGDQITIPVESTAPGANGLTLSVWQLVSPDIGRFGDEYWVEIVVVP